MQWRKASKSKVEVTNYNVASIKKVKPKNVRLQKLISSVLIAFFATAGLSTAVTLPAQASGVSDCPLDIGANPWVESLGGLSTTQYGAAKFGTSVKAEANEATIRDRWSGRITFSSWMPSIKVKNSILGVIDTNDPQADNRSIYKVVPDTYKDSGPAKGYYESKWDSFTTGSHTNVEQIANTALIRKGETYSVGIFSDTILCQWKIGTTQLGDIGSNFMMSIANGINGMATYLYVNANTGTNLTQAVGIQSSGTLDGSIVKDTNYNSWSVELGNSIETMLTGGENGQGLYDSLYLSFLLPVIFIGALVVLINGIRRRAVELLTGIVWMIVVIVGGTLFLTKPMLVPQTIDALVSTITTEVNKAIIGAGNEEVTGCEPSEAAIENDSQRFAKSTECYIWYNTIFKTWAQGQFSVSYGTQDGNSDELTKDYQNTLNKTFSVGGKNVAYKDVGGWAAYQLENGHNPLGSNVAIAMSKNGYSGYFDGAGKGGNAFLALMVSASSAIFIAVNALLIIAYQIIMLLLLMTSPLFLLIGVIPSKTGKGIVLRWVELVLGLAVKRLIIGVLLAVFIKMFLVITLVDIPILIQAFIFGILAYVGITQRGKIMELFTANIDFGGNKRINVGGGIEKAGEALPAIAGGAAAAGVGWATNRAVARGKMAIVSNRDDAFKKKLDAAGTVEEKNKLISERQGELNKKTRLTDLRRGATIRQSEERMLEDSRQDLYFESQNETRQQIEDRKRGGETSTARPLPTNALPPSNVEDVNKGSLPRRTESSQDENSRVTPQATSGGANRDLPQNTNPNDSRNQLKSELDRNDSNGEAASKPKREEQSKAAIEEARRRRKPDLGDGNTPPPPLPPSPRR